MNPLKRIRVEEQDRPPSSAQAGPSSAANTSASAAAPRTPSSPPHSSTSTSFPTRSSPRLPHTPISLDSEQTFPESPWVNPDANGEKWFRRHQEWRKRGHPYELKAALLQVGGRENVYGQDVKFWSWVGPYRPTTDPPGGTWDDWEDCLVISAGPRILVARCTDDKPFDLLWSLEFPGDAIYRADWTFDLFTRHPLIICGGQNGVAYIVNAITKRVMKTYVGHGEEILSISVCRANPHIFATASGDKTTRIWNICGSPPPAFGPDELPSENYPMGDADEGTECVAILAGEGYGHQSKVIGCAFHPRHCAIATSGGDHHVKIWALPAMPMPDRRPVATPRGYRPKIIHFPVFSTSRIHDGAADWIDWVGPDVLASRDPQFLSVWHWLGYRRFFAPNRWLPLTTYAQYTDMHDSHSFADLISYAVPSGNVWFKTPSVHRAFIPQEDEEAKYEGNLVTDCLIAMPSDERFPAIQVFNPALVKDFAPPSPIRYLRPESPSDPWEDLAPGVKESPTSSQSSRDAEPASQPRKGDRPGARGGKSANEREHKTDHDHDHDHDLDHEPSRSEHGESHPEGDVEVFNSIDRIKLKPRHRNPSPTRPTYNTRSGSRNDVDPYADNPSLAPWVLQVKDWKSIERMSQPAKTMKTSKSLIWATAMSPRGAKWIVGVGEVESVFVFRQKE